MTGPVTGAQMHWAARYIGTPWVAGESDCWNLARRVWRERFGWDVPAVLADDEFDAGDPRAARRAFAVGPDGTGWAPVAGVCAPAEGDAVLMAMGRHPCHVGVWLGLPEPHCLHAVEGAGTICTPMERLPGLGYRVVGIYRRLTCAPR